MRNLFIVLVSLITINGFALPPALAESNSGRSVADADSVDEAVAQIIEILENQGFEIENDPFFIAARYDIQDQDARLTAIAGVLNNFA